MLAMRLLISGGALAMTAFLKGRTDDLDPVRKDFAEHQVTSTKQTFAVGGRPKKWPISARALATGGKTLIKSARLKNSIARRVSGDDVLWGTNVAYAKAHQTGVDKKVKQRVRAHTRKTKKSGRVRVKAFRRELKMKLPARPYLALLPEDERYLHRRLHQHYSEPGR
jgi:phage gpG-like protein